MNELTARHWQHKKTKEKVIVLPWWECVDPIFYNKLDGKDPEPAFKVGALVQIGWLLKNKHGVWLGVSFSVKKHFKDLGEYKKPKK